MVGVGVRSRFLLWLSCVVAAACGGDEVPASLDSALRAPRLVSASPAAAVGVGVGGSGPAQGPVGGEPAPSGALRHVSAAGDDANPGTVDQPWRSLARVQAAVDAGALQADDAVLFERGHRYAGSLSLGDKVRGTAGQPIVFGAYGSGAAPVIDGLRALSGWQALGNGRWRAACNDCNATPALLLIDGSTRRLARWPNEDEGDRGYRYFSATNGSTSLTDAAMPADRNWVGGEVVVRSIDWVLDRLPITSQSGGQLNLGTAASYQLQVGYGYFIQNHPDAIDREGEWSYDGAERSITLQSATDPNTRRVEVPVVATLLRLRDAQHVLVRDLVFEGSSENAVHATACSAITLRRLSVSFAGNNGVGVEGCPDTAIEDTIVREAMNGGVTNWRCGGCRIERTTIESIGLHAGMGANGDGAYQGLGFGGDVGRPAVLSGLLVRDIGYIGVALSFAATMSGSLVQRFNQVKVDGGGIYTYRTADITIADNTVLDAGGSTAGIPSRTTGTHGIYIDDNSERITVTRNTVGNVGAGGVYLHNTRDVTVTDNLIFNAGEAGMFLRDDALGTYGLEQTLLRGNTIVVAGVPMLDVSSSQSNTLFDTLGTIDGNRYCDPFDAPTLRAALPGSDADTMSLARWRSLYGRDPASTVCADRLPAFALTGAPGATLVNNGGFDVDLAGWSGWPGDTLDARWESGRLDGGSLRLGFAGPAPQVHFDRPVGSLSAGQDFLLEMSSVAVAGDPSLDVYLRQAGEPYERLSEPAPLQPGDARAEHAVLLRAQQSHADALLVVEMRRAGATVGLDNVKLRPVTATRRTLADAARLEINASSQQRTFTVDVASKTIDGADVAAATQITLPPYKSMVLLRP